MVQKFIKKKDISYNDVFLQQNYKLFKQFKWSSYWLFSVERVVVTR